MAKSAVKTRSKSVKKSEPESKKRGRPRRVVENIKGERVKSEPKVAYQKPPFLEGYEIKVFRPLVPTPGQRAYHVLHKGVIVGLFFKRGAGYYITGLPSRYPSQRSVLRRIAQMVEERHAGRSKLADVK